MNNINNYNVGDYVVVVRPDCYVPPIVAKYRERYIGQIATIREVHIGFDSTITHVKLDIDTESEAPSCPVGPWYSIKWVMPYEDQMNFSLDERQFSFLL